MLRSSFLLLTVLFPVVALAQIFHEVPLSVEAPGYRDIVKAYHNGEEFFVDIASLFEILGFKSARKGPVVEALDASHRYVVDLGLERALSPRAKDEWISLKGLTLLSGDRYLLKVSGLKELFGPDVRFDEYRLELKLSSAAKGFDTHVLRRGDLSAGPLRFGRRRQLLGGVIVTWHAARSVQYHRVHGNQWDVRFTGNLFGGAIRGRLGEAVEVSYLLDRPGSRRLTRIEFGRMRPVFQSDRQLHEAVRVSNRPLTGRHVHRMVRHQGRSQPHALVEAVVSGLVIDRVEADSEGRYVVTIPARYGSTEVLIREVPLGAESPRTKRFFFFSSPDLVEPHRFHYDVYAGRTDKRSMAIGRADWGLLPRLTVRLSGLVDADVRQLRVGASASPLSFVVLRGDADLFRTAYRMSLKAWRRNLTAEAFYEVDHGGRFQAHVVGSKGQFSAHIAATSFSNPLGWSTQRVTQSVSWYGRTGRDASLSVSGAWYSADAKAVTYRASAGHVVALRKAVGRLSLFLRGGAGRPFYETGVEGFVSFREVSFGFHSVWDHAKGDFTGGVTLRLETAAGTVRARHTGRGHHITGSGGLEIARRPRLIQGGRQESSAVLRIFEDLDSDGKLGDKEAVARYVEAQLLHAGLQRQRDGTLRARYLEPYEAYQVKIIERSIRDPRLTPATGYSFGFVADPGRTKVIDVPLVKMITVSGNIRGFDRAPSRLMVHVMAGEKTTTDTHVYRDGGFVLQLRSGQYTLRLKDVLTGELLATAALVLQPDTTEVSVTLAANVAEGR